MKIALVAPLAEAVPPRLYGGTERVLAWLAEELFRQGHTVTLFASGDSKTSANLVACVKQGLRLSGVKDHLASTLSMLKEVRRRADEFDVIHFNIDLLPQALFHDIAHKCAITLHGRLDLPDFMPVYVAYPEMPLISISMNQRKPMPKTCNWLANIPHGLGPEICPFDPEGGNYLAFLGRISPEKRPDRAIEIAKRANLPLKIAAKIDNNDLEYFKTCIEPLLDHPLIEFIGEINEQQKNQFLGKARALLFPIDWPEPFGLVMIEAMSAGTPVIAWRNGSVPEIMRDGVNGFVINSIDEGVAAVLRLDELDRRTVRAEFDARFNARRMTKDYVAAFRLLLVKAARELPVLAEPSLPPLLIPDIPNLSAMPISVAARAL
jgi:glycosyltransferase involved in cell wall biosynthesis